jgi:hypothetical protein
MSIKAEIVADSVSNAGVRITTFQLRYPRFIHAELMTHRVMSRNASSSRAIPVQRMIDDLRRDPAMPVYWGSNKPGMQAGEELPETDRVAAKIIWLQAMDQAIAHVERLIQMGLHKQISNRILEPWAHINVVVTATDWQNFYTLRRHAAAQPELRELADLMHREMEFNEPDRVKVGEWHLPYVTKEELAIYGVQMGKKFSVARCASVSYKTVEGEPMTVERAEALYDKLLGAQPLHASPAEHQATPDDRSDDEFMRNVRGWHSPELHGNLRGWNQLRKMLPGEFVPG